ncbi:MAG: sodium:proton exchanger, partial [Acidobacteria bacterium]
MLKDPFHQIAAALFFATVLGLALARLRQPLIVAYLILGVLAGPNVLKIIPSEGPIDVMAQLGIAILLFLVGLRLDVNVLRSIGKPSLATGAGQVLMTGTAGTLIALALGLDLTPALYVGVALAFSSTIVIVKVLSDKREIDALHGRLSIGYLIVQDIIVVIAMIVTNAIASGGGPGRDLVYVLARGAGLILVLGLAMRFVLPRVTEWVTHPPELGILFALGWAAALAALGDTLGLGKETGAFL